MLGLGDQVGSDEDGVRDVVGDDRDLGGAGLGIGADRAQQQPLRGGDVDIARAADDVGRGAVRGAVGEHGDRLCAADRMHLGDAEQRAGGQHRRGRQAAAGRAGRRRDGDLADARDLRRDHVHHDGRGVSHQAARDVDAGPANRDVPLGDGRAGGDGGYGLARQLRFVHEPGPPGGLGQRGPDVVAESGQRGGQGFRRNPRGGQVNPVEPGRVFPYRGGAALPYVVADRADRVQRARHVQRGPRQYPGERRRGEARGRGAAQVNGFEHPPSLMGVSRPARTGGRPHPSQCRSACGSWAARPGWTAAASRGRRQRGKTTGTTAGDRRFRGDAGAGLHCGRALACTVPPVAAGMRDCRVQWAPATSSNGRGRPAGSARRGRQFAWSLRNCWS